MSGNIRYVFTVSVKILNKRVTIYPPIASEFRSVIFIKRLEPIRTRGFAYFSRIQYVAQTCNRKATRFTRTVSLTN